MSSYFESEFKELRVIGSGGYSTVFKVTHNQNGKLYAIKKIPFNDEESIKALNEVKFLATLNSDYIVEHIQSWVENKYFNIKKTKDHKNQKSLLNNQEKPNLLHIQMELCPKSLDDYIKSQTNANKNIITPKQYSVACDIFTQLLESVQYLHERNPPIIHRDLKPQNILLSNADNNRCVKVSDFGLSTYHEFAEQSHTSSLGTGVYRAPEVITGRDYTTKADIYSLGIIMKQLFNIDVNSKSMVIEPEMKKRYEKLKIICLSCLSPITDQRPNCKQIISKKHQWNPNEDISTDLFCNINDLIYGSIFEFNFEKWPLIINIDLEFLKNCKYMSVIEEIEEKAIIATNDGKAYALRVSDHIDSAIQEPNIINELSNQQIKSIVCGNVHVLCLTKDSRVYSFGDNDCGQLGNGTFKSNIRPSVIKVLTDKRIIDIKCGACHSLALSESGRVYAWGSGVQGQIGNRENYDKNIPIELFSLISEKIILISCGYNHCLALSENGLLYGWGSNGYGQLGIGNNENKNKPKLIPFTDKITVKKISCGSYHSLVLTSKNEIYSFGSNYFGELGIRSYINQNIPTKIQTSIKFIDMETTFYHYLSVGLSCDNKYYVWGECSDQSIDTPKQTDFNSFNETFIFYSNKTLLCQPILTNEKFFDTESILINKFNELENFHLYAQKMKSQMILLTFIRIREYKVIIVKKDDMVYSMRLNESIDPIDDVPISVKELSNIRIKCIVCGFDYVLCLTENNEVYSFGDIDCGNLGKNLLTNTYNPTIITELSNKKIISISCGAYHCLALSECGRVYVWGYGYYGQIGNEMNDKQLTPIEINSLKSIRIISISCGAHHCLALSSNGELYGWGDNSCGQLGIGNDTNQNKPILIENNKKIIITKISCGPFHSLLLSNENIIYSFGANSFGQLGIGNCFHQNSIKRIETKINFIDIHTNWCDNISTAISQTGKYYFWGECGDQMITKPKKTNFTSFDSMFAKYSTYRFTAKQINLNLNV